MDRVERIVIIVKWIVEHWRPACAFIYTVICIFDFVVYPCWIGLHRLDVHQFISITKDMDEVLRTQLYEYVYRPYTPYTLNMGGVFHLSFGAMLTGAMITSKPTIIADRRKEVRDGD